MFDAKEIKEFNRSLYCSFIDIVQKVLGDNYFIIGYDLKGGYNSTAGVQIVIREKIILRNLLSFSLMLYPICCGGCILHNVQHNYNVKKEALGLINTFCELFMEIHNITVCQFMSSYTSHDILLNDFTERGWQTIHEFNNKNSENDCFIIVKTIEKGW